LFGSEKKKEGGNYKGVRALKNTQERQGRGKEKKEGFIHGDSYRALELRKGILNDNKLANTKKEKSG